MTIINQDTIVIEGEFDGKWLWMGDIPWSENMPVSLEVFMKVTIQNYKKRYPLISFRWQLIKQKTVITY